MAEVLLDAAFSLNIRLNIYAKISTSFQASFGLSLNFQVSLFVGYDGGIWTQIQRQELGAIVDLYQLDATSVGDTEIRYFTNTVDEDGSVIQFDGITYTPVDFQAEGFEVSGQGGLPTPTIRISDVNRVFTGLANQFEDMIGAKLTRIRTFDKYLDGRATADPNAIYSRDVFYIEQKTTENRLFIEWKLASAMDHEGRKLPNRVVLRDVCLWRYRTYNADTDSFIYPTIKPCPYTGTAYFDEFNSPTTKANDRCSQELTGCKNRHPGQPVPFGGFPGVGRIRG